MQSEIDKRLVDMSFSAEINGVRYSTRGKVNHGAWIKKDLCNHDGIFVGLIRELSAERFQIVYMGLFHAKVGTYALTDSLVDHQRTGDCQLQTFSCSSEFRAYPGDDVAMDSYRLLEGPWNYLKILSYDQKRSTIKGEFSAKFVRIDKVGSGPEAADTVTYTNGKFLLTNMYVQEVITVPR
jgi:hypothetical protein